jgi:DNA-binding NtrC family response regulator
MSGFLCPDGQRKPVKPTPKFNRITGARNPIVADDKINILLVDDEEALLDTIKRRLQIRAFNVIAVNRGEKALEVARSHPIDVAILDLKMPGMSGKEVLVNLKRDYPWLEIVILTGHGSFNPEQEAVYDQAYTYLAKPCELETLLHVLVEAYKKTVMNKNKIAMKDMEAILRTPTMQSAREVLKKLKELDSQPVKNEGGS